MTGSGVIGKATGVTENSRGNTYIEQTIGSDLLVVVELDGMNDR